MFLKKEQSAHNRKTLNAYFYKVKNKFLPSNINKKTLKVQNKSNTHPVLNIYFLKIRSLGKTYTQSQYNK